MLRYAGCELQEDKEVVTAAIEEWDGAIAYAGPEMQSSEVKKGHLPTSIIKRMWGVCSAFLAIETTVKASLPITIFN
jgi:hypothetical protein